MRFHVNALKSLCLALAFTGLVLPQVCLAGAGGGSGVDEPSVIQHLFGPPALDGTNVNSTLVSVNSALYGTTTNGGPGEDGIIFSLTPIGQYQIVYSFGALATGPSRLVTGYQPPKDPTGPLAAVGSVIYGTTKSGGFYNGGTLYSYNTATGSLQILHNFGGYGSASPNGVSTDGTVVVGSITTAGAPANTGGLFLYNIASRKYSLESFNVSQMQNSMPAGPPVPLNSSTWAGVTTAGGMYGAGTVYTFTPQNGQFSYVHSFTGVGADQSPVGVAAIAGALYGVTGSSTQPGELFSMSFSTSVPNSFSVLHLFGTAGGTDPSEPSAAPTVVTTPLGQMLVGLLRAGGNGFGAVYTVGLDGSNYSIIHNFSGYDSGIPDGGLVTGPDGNLWGTGNPLTFKASVFRLGPQISNAAPITTDVYNGGQGDLVDVINGTGFATNVTAMFDKTPVEVEAGGTSTQVSLKVPASLLTQGSHVITLRDPNIGNDSNTIVVTVGGVHLRVSFGNPNNVDGFQDIVTIANTGYSVAANVQIVSAQLIYSNGAVVPLQVYGSTADIQPGQSSQFAAVSPTVVATGSPVLVVHWAYTGGKGGAATRLHL